MDLALTTVVPARAQPRAGTVVRSRVLASDVPATPSAQEARDAADRELAKPAYHPRQDVLEAALTWLRHHLDPAGIVPGVPAWLSVLIVVLAAGALIAAVLLTLTRLSAARASRVPSHALFASDERDAATLRAAADAAVTRSDWATAVIERYRAIIRSLDERGLIDDHPGLTAHEAAVAAAEALGGLGGDLVSAARVFDFVRYGDLLPTEHQDQSMRDLAERVAAAAPRAPESSPAPERWTVRR